jgi:tetraacyldisaccharide 4'-kinase
MPSDARVVAAAGIARPERFFEDLTAAGWVLAASLPFPDHRAFNQRDVRRIAEAAKTTHASLVLTTEKDAVRLRACDLSGLAVAAVPLAVTVEPAEPFSEWLMNRIRAGR